MMYPRLKLARNLLMSDGLLCVSIDDHEGHNVRCICDEIFGEEAFVGTLTWIATTQPDNIGRTRFGLQQNVEYVFVYSKCARLDLPPFILKSSGGIHVIHIRVNSELVALRLSNVHLKELMPDLLCSSRFSTSSHAKETVADRPKKSTRVRGEWTRRDCQRNCEESCISRRRRW